MYSSVEKYITSESGKNCTGCKMCADVCFAGAISFKVNGEGFWYPLVNNKCVSCGKCVRVCPVFGNNTSAVADTGNAQMCYGCRNKMDEIRLQSTSGGFFSSLAYQCFLEGYSVVGALYDKDMKVTHCLCDNKEDIYKLRQSKYVQSDTAGIYKQVADRLKTGGKVLFVGTPCQVAALYSFLDAVDLTCLLTMDFICYGVPSCLVYKRYLEWLEKKYGSKIVSIQFKNKERGWRSLGTLVAFKNGKKYLKNGSADYYMQAFVGEGFATRESCYNCKFRSLHHESDFTVGDFWGVEKIKPDIDDNKGITAVIVNTNQGLEWFEKIRSTFVYFETNIEDIAVGNFTIHKSAEYNPKREEFLKYLGAHSIDKAMRKYGKGFGVHGFARKVYLKARKILGKLIKAVIK